MKSYFELFKNDIIDFNKLIIDKYAFLGIDEIDCVLLIKLNNQLKSNDNVMNSNVLSSSMAITDEECAKRIVKLVNSGFITLEISTNTKKQIFSLNEGYQKLGFALENIEEKNQNEEKNKAVKTTINLLEKELKKMLSSIEIQIVNKWFFDYDYTIEDVNEAILDALKYKNRGINYIDRVLFKKYSVTLAKDDVIEEDLQKMFKNIYGKK